MKKASALSLSLEILKDFMVLSLHCLRLAPRKLWSCLRAVEWAGPRSGLSSHLKRIVRPPLLDEFC
jgi:hypothetical protein